MEYTTNYHLPQWVETDRIQMEDFNEAMRNIETGFESTKNEMTESFDSELETMQKSVGSTGHNLRMVAGSYIGTGAYGESNPVTLQSGMYPVLVQIYCQTDKTYAMVMRPCTVGYGNMPNNVVSWTDNGVSWYGPVDGSYMMNTKSGVYHYILLGYDPV